MNNHICRAKSLDTGEWVYGYYVSTTDPLLGCAYHYILSQKYNDNTGLLDSFMTWCEVDPSTVCRYTEQEDVDGTPIFEHDILHGVYYHMFEDINTFEVCWDKYVGGFGINTFEPTKCKILGNIFDNTELMEEA